MLSALVLMPPHIGGTSAALGALVRSLAALVPATVEGIVRDVSIVTDRADDGLRRVADHAGCRIVDEPTFEAGFATALAGARSDLLFVLRAGIGFDRGLINEIGMRLGPDPTIAGGLLLREDHGGLMSRLLPNLSPIAGVIAARADLSGRPASFKALVGGLKATQTLASRAQFWIDNPT
ncbi:hypothetical protein LGH83_06725 [Lichenihabitans sp. PAMC28606]|uniref:hypothetical protein n=1 Tax=Lichenihabitans sp. PAMC28606 TaxID=2880932 RepID=UPI001D0A5FA9|nr:hypothetical protein [Lichenihabitans sp. PAMC28606]UDL95885.1 hypothetical protein LGH83_06725 [Lichenihabitans sp. PAMC28606]